MTANPHRARARRRWALFGLCAALVLAAMAWTSDRLRAFETSQRAAEQETARQASLRVALWRMDSALAPLLAQEAARPFQRLVALDNLNAPTLEPWLDEAFSDPRVRVRFALHDAAVVVPRTSESPNSAAAVAAGFAAHDRISSRIPRPDDDARVLAALRSFGATALRARVRRDARAIADWIAATNVVPLAQEAQPVQTFEPAGGAQSVQVLDNVNDRAQRARSTQNRILSGGQNGGVQVDWGSNVRAPADAQLPDPAQPFVPVWLAADGRRDLVFVREPFPLLAQGFVLDWERVRTTLLAEVTDLFPDATLEPVAEAAVAHDATGLILATAPARLVVPTPAAAPFVWTPTCTGLAVAWLAVLGALGAAALTLRTTVADADRRARFASSVTHELRTPLTTFRLYSEMLADGMVTGEATRAEYLRTLKTESARLATLVENVLAYARVEEGRAPRQRERLAVGDLVERSVPSLRRRADEAGMRLVVRSEPGAASAVVEANADALGQVLANLVDNACKYAGAATDRSIELAVETAPAAAVVRISVRDHGPGLAPENVAAAFTPFERGNRPPGDAVPGIGLGLALSRGLARDHGGDLVHEAPDDGPGAAFVLTIPVPR